MRTCAEASFFIPGQIESGSPRFLSAIGMPRSGLMYKKYPSEDTWLEEFVKSLGKIGAKGHKTTISFWRETPQGGVSKRWLN